MPAKRDRKKKQPEIDPELLPAELRKVNPHDPLATYFLDSPDPDLFEKFADFYEKRPKEAVQELVNTLIRIAGASTEITYQQIKKSSFEEVAEAVRAELEESTAESPISKYFKGSDEKAFTFWTEFCNSMIVCKGLFSAPFDVFKDWAFEFCESKVRPLRETATVAVLAIEQFLAESISKASTELEKLNDAKEKDQVVKRQIDVFTTELKSSKALSMQLFTTVIKNRFRDSDPKIRQLCVRVMGSAGLIAPDEFGDANIMKYIGSSLRDESAKLRKEALKQGLKLIGKKNYHDSYAPFFKGLTKDLVECCHDVDNGVVVAAFDLMTKMADRGLMKENAASGVFRLVADEAGNVRNAAAKFFYRTVFEAMKKTVEKNQKAVLYEAQIREFCRLSADLTEYEVQLAIDAFWKVLHCLRKWELICLIILSEADDEKETAMYAHMLSLAAKRARDESSKVKKLTVAMMKYMSKMLALFKDDQVTTTRLVSIANVIDIGMIDEHSTRQFKALIEDLHRIFINTQDKEAYQNVLAALNSWKAGMGKVPQLAAGEFAKIANDFKKFKEFDSTKMAKFAMFSEWFDCSKDKKLRRFLKEQIDSDDEEFAASAIRAFEHILKWDARALRGKEPEEKTEYEDEFRSLQTLISSKLQEKSMMVKSAAFMAIATLYGLAGMTGCLEQIDDLTVSSFFQTFHSLDDKVAMFPYLIRPLLTNSVESKFAVHVFWYLQDPVLKPLVNDFIAKFKDELPVDGVELGNLVRTQEFSFAKLKQAAKSMSKHVRARGAVDSWLDEPDDKYLPIFAPFIEKLTTAEAELLEPRAFDQTAKVLLKRSHGQTLTAKDFVVEVKKPKRAAKHESDESNDEADASEVEIEDDDESE